MVLIMGVILMERGVKSRVESVGPEVVKHTFRFSLTVTAGSKQSTSKYKRAWDIWHLRAEAVRSLSWRLAWSTKASTKATCFSLWF